MEKPVGLISRSKLGNSRLLSEEHNRYCIAEGATTILGERETANIVKLFLPIHMYKDVY